MFVSSSVFASKQAEETPKGKKENVQKNQGGCVLFFFVSKGFVINRKGCEAEIAESIPCREKRQKRQPVLPASSQPTYIKLKQNTQHFGVTENDKAQCVLSIINMYINMYMD